jgi:hypothetical protein
LSSLIGSVLSWSPDSTQLAYTTIEVGESELITVVMLADFTTGEISFMVGKESKVDYHYNALAWSPLDKDKLILGFRPDPENVSSGLWLVHPTRLEGQMFAREDSFSYTSPAWDPWGRTVVFQQSKLKTAVKPEIAVWEQGLDTPKVIAEGFSPHWLP